MITKAISVIGWATSLVSIVVFVYSLLEVGLHGSISIAVTFPALALSVFKFFISGLILVAVSQALRAMMDNANYSKQILEELKEMRNIFSSNDTR